MDEEEAESITNRALAPMSEGTVKGRAAGIGPGQPDDLRADELLTILSLAGFVGSLRMDILNLGATPTADLYPTNGAGGAGFGRLFGESYLRSYMTSVIDGVICTFNSSGGTIQFKDATGVPLDEPYDFIVPMPQPLFIPLGIPVNVLGGFTAQVHATPPGNGVGFTVLFRGLTT